jgi:exonuclease III
VATLNINGITQHTRLKMLEDFLMRHDIDLALLQKSNVPATGHLKQICTIHKYWN